MTQKSHHRLLLVPRNSNGSLLHDIAHTRDKENKKKVYKSERQSKWCDLGERFVDCMLLLNYKFDMTTEDEFNRFQLCVDLFCTCFRDLVGIDKETNYIQNMSAGVFKFFLRKYGSIYAYNNTAMEAGHEQDCGKVTLKAICSDKDKARRDKNKAMRANGINLVDSS